VAGCSARRSLAEASIDLRYESSIAVVHESAFDQQFATGLNVRQPVRLSYDGLSSSRFRGVKENSQMIENATFSEAKQFTNARIAADCPAGWSADSSTGYSGTASLQLADAKDAQKSRATTTTAFRSFFS